MSIAEDSLFTKNILKSIDYGVWIAKDEEWLITTFAGTTFAQWGVAMIALSNMGPSFWKKYFPIK